MVKGKFVIDFAAELCYTVIVILDCYCGGSICDIYLFVKYLCPQCC